MMSGAFFMGYIHGTYYSAHRMAGLFGKDSTYRFSGIRGNFLLFNGLSVITINGFNQDDRFRGHVQGLSRDLV